MKHQLIALLCIGFLFLVSCATPDLVLSSDLDAGTDVMEVTGRQGWQVNQEISYGAYRTTPVKRGWTTVSGVNFIIKGRSAEQELSFTQVSPAGNADVSTVGSYRSINFGSLEPLGFPIELENSESSYYGAVVPESDPDNPWEFLINDPDGADPDDAELAGYAADRTGRSLRIRGVQEIEGQVALFKSDYFGFEFFHEGMAVGAVSTLNAGRVWIRGDLDNEMKLVIASLSTSILLRHSLQDAGE